MIKFKKMVFFIIMAYCFFFMLLCSTDMEIINQNSPDKNRALGEPGDIESLVAGSFRQWWGGLQKYYPGLALSVTANELTSSWGNFGMREFGEEPRKSYDNKTTANYKVNETPWYSMYKAISAVNDGLISFNVDPSRYEGEINVNRAKAFAKFMQGISHGYIALLFDNGFIYDETVDLETTTLDLQPYTAVNDAAIGYLEECIQLCNSNTFELPDTWIAGITPSNTYLAQLCHSYIARFMASVPRSTAENANVDWATVLDHANQGIDYDFVPIGDGNYWWDGLKFYGPREGWTRADYETIGILDTSGKYQTWLNTPYPDRTEFLIEVPDKRITNGDPESDGSDFFYSGASPFRPDRGTWFFSYYYHHRYIEHMNAGGAGPMPGMILAEMDMIKAEAKYNLGQSGVAALVNNYRVNRGQLPPLSDGDSNLWEMLKYDKRIETFNVASGVSFFDDRRWGDLRSGSIIHFPVPGKELDILQLDYYTYGGGGEGSAPKVSSLRDALSLILGPDLPFKEERAKNPRH